MSNLKIYIAGTVWFGIAKDQPEYNKLVDPYLRQIAEDVENRLESFHYVGKGRRYNEMIRAGVKIFLDSGAFSAHTLGINIDLEEYCNYIKANKEIILHEDGVMLASVLDGIGDASLTYENQMRMQALGVTPLPCFHAGEDEQYLEWYVQNYPYITLGGLVGGSTQQLQVWLDRIWTRHLMDRRGKAKIKVHGFGITSIPLMERYPWWSVDSTSWIQTASFGAITIPGYGNLEMSKESPSRHVRGKHITTLTDIERKWVTDLLDSQGFDAQYIIDGYHGRATYNLYAYKELQRLINDKRTALGDHIPMPQELWNYGDI